MSRSWSGNILGLFIVVLGCAAGYGAYRISFEWGIVIGVGVALFGAAIVNPLAIREGAKEFRDSGLVDLLPIKLGRRASDPVVIVPVTPEPPEDKG